MTTPDTKPRRISAIVPARNEEAVIAECVESIAQQREVLEILVVNDQSSDHTAEIVRALMSKHPQVRLLETKELPSGWVGKNNAAWLGTREAKGQWLLFTDADVVHEPNSAAKALEIAGQRDAAMISFSPEQVMETWYEKALIPYVYCQLAKEFSFEEVNDPQKPAAAANGQFLLIRRDAYEVVGGHASVAGDVLEDVALAKRVKSAGFRIWFGSGKGIVRARMYRSFAGMWEGWKKNLYRLMGGKKVALARGIGIAVAPVLATLIAAVGVGGLTDSVLNGVLVLLLGVFSISTTYDGELKRNGFARRLIWYGIPGRLLYAAALWASNRSHRKGKLKWKGRAYPVGGAGASNEQRKMAMVYLTRKIEFSASHLYHNPALSAEENKRIFGKCNNPHGHGHNYTLEVTVAGEPDPVTGMVLDLKELKAILEREITQRMDHRFLNYEVAELKGQIPTCENIAKTIWNLLEPKIVQGRLHKVRLYETPDLFADCYRNGASRT